MLCLKTEIYSQTALPFSIKKTHLPVYDSRYNTLFHTLEQIGSPKSILLSGLFNPSNVLCSLDRHLVVVKILNRQN